MHDTPTQKEKAMNAAKRMKVKLSTLAFCVCSYSACESQRGRHVQRGGGGGGEKRRGIFICEMRRLAEVPTANNASGGG